MTVDELIEKLKELSKTGHGGVLIQCPNWAGDLDYIEHVAHVPQKWVNEPEYVFIGPRKAD